MATPSRNEFHIRISPWYDLVYHALSHLPLTTRDASSLFDPAYVSWSDAWFGSHSAGDHRVPRTLPRDAPLLAAMYADSKQGSLLHAWPLLYDGIDEFRAQVRTDFDKLEWDSADRAQLAGAMIANCHAALPELFRTALWSELQHGYEAFWSGNAVPRVSPYRERFAKQLDAVADRLPELADVEWLLCHPLRVHGRLLRTGRPIIAVGVADRQFGVDESAPVMQGCHEYFVWTVQRASPSATAWSSCRNGEGYSEFRRVENAALARGARCFLGSPHEVAYLTWLGRVAPGRPAAETAAQLASAACT
jgi:hypothetical protein